MYAQILVPLDGSDASERALSHAQSLANAFGANLHLLQAVSHAEELDMMRGGGDSPLSMEYASDLARQIITARLTQAEQYLNQVASRLQADGLNVETSVEEGAASEKILEYIEKQSVDLVVMSTHGHGGIRRFFTGSVTDRVIRSANVPVLAVPPT